MRGREWELLVGLVKDKLYDLKLEREEIEKDCSESLEEHDEIIDKYDLLLCHLNVHIEYLKEITHWREYMNENTRLGYLTSIMAYGIGKPKAKCGFAKIPEAS